MRNEPFRYRNNGDRRMSCASAVLDECNDMVKQMALPLVPQRRVKGALGAVSRESGISYSKVRKIYYRLTDHILEFEFRSIAKAYERHVVSQERKLEQELADLRALREAREMRERHGKLDISTPSRGLASAESARGHSS